jgi:hypothetical protein
MLVQAALVTCGLVCMNESFSCCAVNDRYGSIIGLLGLVTVTGCYGRDHFFDGCAHVGPLTGITLTVYFCLSCAL